MLYACCCTSKSYLNSKSCISLDVEGDLGNDLVIVWLISALNYVPCTTFKEEEMCIDSRIGSSMIAGGWFIVSKSLKVFSEIPITILRCIRKYEISRERSLISFNFESKTF